MKDRAIRACNRCVSKHIRCSGSIQCINCTKAKTFCIYDNIIKKNKKSKSHKFSYNYKFDILVNVVLHEFI